MYGHGICLAFAGVPTFIEFDLRASEEQLGHQAECKPRWLCLPLTERLPRDRRCPKITRSARWSVGTEEASNRRGRSLAGNRNDPQTPGCKQPELARPLDAQQLRAACL